MSKYPQDEFDRIPETASRQGVHRERLVAVRGSGLGLKIAVGVLALLVGLAAYFLLPRLELGGAGSASAANAGSAAASTPAPTGSSDRLRSPEPGSPEATGTAAPSAPATPSPDPTPASVDKAQKVNVLNSTGVPGLAGTVVGRLAADGWTGALPGNWAGSPLEGSVVFYNGAEQRAGAEAVASALGIAAVQDGAGVSPDLTVVIGPELQ
ncbi:LytR family transcriptional regulator [Arthrobacter crusticola]|uniref:LytR family transcriptional regulator n=1 Tax=Arthrobacter crusticola TaxID=2547960 RepID=A0A4R5TZ21_9MICC|nr:LytR C-terminal domain-containing protein [Arthrobacter crusticola]TDK26421.1 LytR family transcriptional regulator [Arthrobacter crusticola]